MANGLTRICWIEGVRHPNSKRHIFYNDSIERIFCLRGEDLLDAEDESNFEKEDDVNDNLEDKALTRKIRDFFEIL